MYKHTDSVRSRVRPVALLAVMAMLFGVLAVSLGGVARADTSGTPDTNTKAALAPATVSASTGLNPPGPLSGAVGGQTVNIHVDGVAGKFFGVNARLCRSGLNVQLPSQMSPTSSGNCIAAPLPGAANDDFVSASAATANTSVDFAFRVGSGTETSHPGPGAAITCDATHPCAIWLDEQVDTTVQSNGDVFKHYDVTYAGAPGAPGVSSSPGNTQLSITLTAPASNGNSASALTYSVSLSGGDCGSIPAACAARAGAAPGPTTFTGLTNFQAYTASATATSTAANGTTTFTGPAGTAGPNASTTPVPPAPTNVSGSPGNHKVDLTWTAPSGPTPDHYEVLATPCNSGTTAAPCPAGFAAGTAIGPNSTGAGNSATTYSFTGLTNGQAYVFQARALYTGGTGQYSAPSGMITPNGVLVTQTITARRPAGALVLTQVCGVHAADPITAVPVTGSPYEKANEYTAAGGPGLAPASSGTQYTPPVVAGSVPPTPGTLNPTTDPLFGQYPYPTDANGEPIATYPTDCGVNLGTAKFITSGAGAGQFFRASGPLNQVTVADTRDTDPGFTVNGQMSSFTAPAGTFSGSELGWDPVKSSSTPAFTDSNGNTYTQVVNPGAVIQPNSPNASGLSAGGKVLASSPGLNPVGCTTACNGGLGIAVLDAKLVLLIPVTAKTGNYTGTLSLSAV